MYQEVLNIMNSYIDDDKNPDVEFITSIIDVFNKNYYKNDTVENIKLGNYEGFDAKYVPNDKTLFFSTSYYAKNNCKSNVIEMVLSIFHEYVHVIQYEHTDSEKRNICDRLVYISFTVFNKNNNDDYLHDYIPVERLANLSSLFRLINVLSLDKERFNNALLFYKRKFFEYLIDGYKWDDEKLSYPLEILFNKTNLGSYNDNLVKLSHNLSFQERLLYGLPISGREYGVVRKEYINSMYDEEEYKKKILQRR